MAVPVSRNEFKNYVLRGLGAPVINVDVAPDQLDDRVDEALSYFWDYHFDGAEKLYYKHQITQDNKDDGFIELPENIIGAVSIFDIGIGYGIGDIFNIQYQIALNDLYTLTSVSLVPYYMAMTHLSMMEYVLIGKQPIRYERHSNKLYVDMNWDRVNVGEYLVVEAYSVIDPDTYVNVWKDRWLYRYTACLVKQQWGTNTKKFSEIKGPGGVIINGQKMFDEATLERAMLEQEMITSYSRIPSHFIG